MTKTPEQLAEEYASKIYRLKYYVDGRLKPRQGQEGLRWLAGKNGFLAGYQAAMNSPEKLDSCEHILDMEKMVDVNSCSGWISVKERLPEDDVWCVWWSFDERCENGIGRREVGDSLDWWSDYDYWCELPKLPEAPKGEG